MIVDFFSSLPISEIQEIIESNYSEWITDTIEFQDAKIVIIEKYFWRLSKMLIYCFALSNNPYNTAVHINIGGIGDGYKFSSASLFGQNFDLFKFDLGCTKFFLKPFIDSLKDSVIEKDLFN